jgi:class 3 adenylate cyclase
MRKAGVSPSAINVGDVIVEPHDIFGDGVNIAARLENIAEPGGICISSSAYDHVRGKVGVESPIWASRASRILPAAFERMRSSGLILMQPGKL